jgi:predicted nucleic acid-binding protein
MTIVDTTVWIDYLAGTVNLETDWLDDRLSQQSFGLTDLILCEVLQGVHSKRAFVRIREELSPFPIFNTGGEDLAIASMQNYRLLRERGFTVRKTIDCVIATFCMNSGHTLLHRDRDFDLFKDHLGLRVVHPSTH